MGARETALCALMACRQSGAWANVVLKDYTKRDHLDSRDAALAARLCYGTIQNRAKLDFYLNQLLTQKGKSLHPVVRDILHLGLYQIYEMDKIPASAAVNESVALTKKYVKNPKAGPLVNAVLRNAVRTKGQLQEPTSYEDRYSHPAELVSLLKANLPKGKLEEVLIANNTAPETMVQVNTLRTTAEKLAEDLQREGVTAVPHPWIPDCLVLSSCGDLEKLKAFQKGDFYVQDPASKLAVLCARLPKEGARVLDCCAAPGGKSFAAAIAMEGNGSIVSCDLHQHKTALMEKGAQRLGLTNISVRLQDATVRVGEWENAMDVVLADVPCSGLGIIRKKPDIRYKDIAETEELPKLQLQILENQSAYVKKGGVLMYSTCTILKRENEQVVEAFLGAHPEFCLEPLNLPGNFPKNESGMLTLLPGEYDTDGFFICRLRRQA